MSTTAAELGGVVDIGRLLGVTKQRASVLVRREGFPAPEVDGPALAGRRLWRLSEVKAWNEARNTPREDPCDDD